jgi:hypothetical protein
MNREFLEGKKAICRSCKNQFILTWQQLRNKKPVCEFCTKSPKAEELREARDAALKLTENLPFEITNILNSTTEESDEAFN